MSSSVVPLLNRKSVDASHYETSDSARRVFQVLGKRKAESLNLVEFCDLDSLIFTDIADDNSDIRKEVVDCMRQVFDTFDADRDQLLNFTEFSNVWRSNWMHTIFKPTAALLVVDIQNDFIDGSLALKNCPAGDDAAAVIPVINRIVSKHAGCDFKMVVLTQDWHPPNHCSFAENVHLRKLSAESLIKTAADAKPFDTVIFDDETMHHRNMEQKLWPTHCVQNTWGASLHANLKVFDDLPDENFLIIQKGVDADMDCYSAFGNRRYHYETKLFNLLKAHNITDVFVCGLAYDVCVYYTLIDALELGFRTVFIEDAARGVALESMKHARESFVSKNGFVTNSDNLGALLSGQIRPSISGIQGLKCFLPQDVAKRATNATNGNSNGHCVPISNGI